MTRPVLIITSLCKSYVIDNAEHRVLADISLEAHEGEFLCIVGVIIAVLKAIHQHFHRQPDA